MKILAGSLLLCFNAFVHEPGCAFMKPWDLGRLEIMGKMGQNEQFLWLIGAFFGKKDISHYHLSSVCFSFPVMVF